MGDLLRCERLEVGWGGQALLPPIDLTVAEGELWAVVGRNGAGKSTFFRTLLGLMQPIGGRVVRDEAVEMAWLAQQASFDPLYPVRVKELVSDGTIRGWSFLRPFSSRQDEVRRAMEAVGIADLADRTVRSLSGGQRQRALFARMLASGARLVLLDEPTVGMDAVAEREVLDLLVRLRREYGLTVMVVSHSLSVARELADQVLFLDAGQGRVVAGAVDAVFADPAFVARYGTVLTAGRT